MTQPYYESGGITIYHGDCLEVLDALSAVDLVVTDPPYTFGLASTFAEGKAGSWGDMMNNAHWYASWLGQCQRLTQNTSGAAWVFNSWRSFPVLAKAAMETPWPIESLLVWDKQWIGPGGQRGLRPSYELVALFAQPAFALADRGLPDIWQQQWSAIKPTGHAAEKPLQLMGRLIRESVDKDDAIILDPFMGSGTTLRAAKDAGHRAIGIEVEERWCEFAATRLAQEVFAL